MINKIKLILILFLLISTKSNFKSTRDELESLCFNSWSYDFDIRTIINPRGEFCRLSAEDYQKALKIRQNFLKTMKRRGVELTNKGIEETNNFVKKKDEYIKPEFIHKRDGIVDEATSLKAQESLRERLLTAYRHGGGSGEEAAVAAVDAIFKIIEKK